jgi:hypothetical protein
MTYEPMIDTPQIEHTIKDLFVVIFSKIFNSHYSRKRTGELRQQQQQQHSLLSQASWGIQGKELGN